VTIILILVVALVAGMILKNRWALLLPLAVGACAAFVVASTGHSLNDTPIPFLVAVSTLVMVGGQGASRAKIQGITKEHHPNAVQ
jgi:hypothetical protein